MKLSYRVEGGIAYFPGLAQEKSVDSSALRPETAERLTSLVTDVSATALETAAPPPPHVADAQVWSVTVQEDGGSVRGFSINEAVATEQERQLIELLRSLGE